MSAARPILGHIRFSFFGSTDTRLHLADGEEGIATLYEDARMARRFHLFERLTLPSLRAQSDKDFRIVVLTSDVMPARYQDRLRAITADDAFIHLEFSAQRTGRRGLAPFIRQSLGADGMGTAVHFRLDDDDALANDYIARLRAIAAVCAPRTHISFPYGIALFPTTPGSSEGTAIPERHLLPSPGLAIVLGEGFAKNPFQMKHGSVWERWPVMSDPTYPAYIRTHHQHNDTVLRQDKVLAGLRNMAQGRHAGDLAAMTDQILAERFPFITRPDLTGLLADLAIIETVRDLPAVA